MTYPLFITIFSWILFREQRDPLTAGAVIIAFIGVWMVISPGNVGFKLSSLWGLASGITASVAILYLNISRQHHDTNTILFFMFGGGTIMMLLIFYNHIFIPNLAELYYLVCCASIGILGQYLLTIGFRYVTAVEGSVISFTRILLAAFIGPYLLDDPILTGAGWIGALLIFISNTVLAVRKINRQVGSEKVN